MPFIGKTRILMKKGLTGATGNYYTGLHDFEEMCFLLHFLREEDLFADVGANVGSYTILASGHIGCKSISFEPIPSTFKLLFENVQINKLDDLVFHYNVGIASNQTTLFFTNSYDTINHVYNEGLEKKENTTSIPVYPLDFYIEKHGIPNLIKIDVEGYESEVLQGMKLILESEKLKAIIIELNGSGWRYNFDELKIHNDLKMAGFSPYTYKPLKRNLQLLDSYGMHNTIYIRDFDFVNNRLKTANKIFIFNENF